MTLWPNNGWLNHCSVHITAQVFLTADILFLTHSSAKSPKSHTFWKNLQKHFHDTACQFMWSEVDYDVYEWVEWTKVLTITRTIFLFNEETNQARFADTLMFWKRWRNWRTRETRRRSKLIFEIGETLSNLMLLLIKRKPSVAIHLELIIAIRELAHWGKVKYIKSLKRGAEEAQQTLKFN